jgi:signal transduction histidine kinase/CheY-like chemotaxis protein
MPPLTFLDTRASEEVPHVSFTYLFGIGALVFVSYFITARLGLEFSAVHTFAALLWPPTGIAFAALFLYGYRLSPAIAIAAFVVNLSVGAPPLAALGIGVGNMLEALLAVYLIRRYIDTERLFKRVRGTLIFCFFILLAAMVSPSMGFFSLWAAGALPSSAFFVTWVSWWVGDILGALILAPFLITWLSPRYSFSRLSPPWRIFEFSVIVLLLLLANALNFMRPSFVPKEVALLYLVGLPLAWAALRSGARGMTLALVINVLAVIWAALFRKEEFIFIFGNLFFLQMYIGVMSFTFLLFLSIVKEQEYTERALEENVARLEHALKKVRSIDRAKTDFLAVLAHELRNPLAPALSSLELLKLKGITRENARKTYDSIATQLKTVVHLLDDLLDISRISKGKVKLEKEIVNMRSVITRSVQSVDPFMKAEGHTVSLSIEEGPLFVDGDFLRLQQIFINLLTNAAKYTPRKGIIHIKAWKEPQGRFLAVNVGDSGIGIQKEMLTRIFEPFIQGAPHSAHKAAGLGVGLSLTKQLVELHGGTIEARSAGLGAGSEFIVTLPVSHLKEFEKSHAVSSGTLFPLKPAESAPRDLKRDAYRILVVDDNEAAAKGIAKLLSFKGHRVEVAYEGSAALKVMQAFNPRVAILDIGLPGMSGYELAQKIRETGASITLIALTGYGLDEDKLKAKISGFDHHLTKPVGIADIEEILQKLRAKKSRGS